MHEEEHGNEVFLEDHWRKIGKRAFNDFRSNSIAKKALQLLGDAPGPILDAGCGLGTFLICAHKSGHSVVGIDASGNQVREARSILLSKGLPPQLARCCSIEEMLSEGLSFGSCVALDVLEHLSDPESFLRLLWKLLSVDCTLVVSVPAVPAFYDERDKLSGHYRRYEPSLLQANLAEGGFVVKRMQYWNFLGWFKRWLDFKVNPEKVSYYEFRYNPSPRSRALNSLLRLWFLYVENQVKPPIGLSLLAVAKRAQ